MANYIDIEVSGKLPSAGGAAHGIVCCNSDYRLRFKFSAEWNAYADKTVLLSDGDALYSVTLADSATECGLPRISRPGTFELGVIAGDGPALATVGLPVTVIPSICTRAEGALAADGNASGRLTAYLEAAETAAKDANSAAAAARSATARANEAADSVERAKESAAYAAARGEWRQAPPTAPQKRHGPPPQSCMPLPQKENGMYRSKQMCSARNILAVKGTVSKAKDGTSL